MEKMEMDSMDLWNDGSAAVSSLAPEDAGTEELTAPLSVMGSGSTDVSSGDVPLYPLESSGYLLAYMPEAPAGEVSVSSGDTIDYTETLNHIDSTLTLVVFLLCAGWGIRHIKNAVRSFTGRNLL